jgi:flagellar protein FliS
MFANARNALSAYRKVGVDAAIEVADPHRLILLLFAGAQAAIGNARAAMQQQQIAAKGEAISKAIDIIGNGLKLSLDLEKGGEIAQRLDALYDYLVVRLLRANLTMTCRRSRRSRACWKRFTAPGARSLPSACSNRSHE